MIEYGHFIGGKHVAGKSGRTGEVFQPMDGTVRAHVALASKPRSAPRSRTPRRRSRPGPRSIRSAAPAC